MTLKNSIIYLDNHLIVVEKAAGLLVQGDKSRDESLLDEMKYFLAHKFEKPGDVFVGLVHRLDRPVSGLVVLARNSKSAARLSQQIREKQMRKKYVALVEGTLANSETWTDQLQRFEKVSRVSKTNGKTAKLTFKRIAQSAGTSLVEIDLITGRHHQIRAQFSSRNHPIVGDALYGARTNYRSGQIALHSFYIGIKHPISREALAFYSQLPNWSSYLNRNR